MNSYPEQTPIMLSRGQCLSWPGKLLSIWEEFFIVWESALF